MSEILPESTVDAERSGRLDLLLEQRARVPWDDRAAPGARIEDLRETKVREHLRDVQSRLLELPDTMDVYRRLRIVEPVNDHEVPRNVGLLFFSENPERWFTGASIEVVHFAADRAGKVQDERTFRGPLADQVRDCLRYFEGLSQAHLQKHRDRSQVRGWVSHPQLAFREALVNAVYHRAYRADVVEPTKVFLYPNRVEVISYPGPVAGIELHHLEAGGQIPPIPARNRRIGEFLKELDLGGRAVERRGRVGRWGWAASGAKGDGCGALAEGRFTGLPQMYDAMRQNGSPPPIFDFDAGRSYFRVTLPAHPEYAAVSAIQDAAYLRAVGSPDDALARIQEAWRANASSTVLATEMIRLHAERGEVGPAEQVWAKFLDEGPEFGRGHVTNVLVEAFLEIGEKTVARRALDTLGEVPSSADAIDTAILARRLNEQRIAHRYFERAGDAVAKDVRALHELAQTKIHLARDAYQQRSASSREANHRLLLEARDLLERVVLMEASPTRHAWAWRDLARVRDWLHAPRRDVVAAFERACGLLPEEPRFVSELERFNARKGIGPSRPNPGPGPGPG